MAKTNSKSIGNNYERDFSKKLSLWLSDGETDDGVWRDLSSGARATTRKKDGKDTIIKGDIVAVNFAFQWFFDIFFIDTKSYKEFNPFMINSKNMKSNSILNEWIKVCNDCPDNLIPFMPCKIRDRKTPELIILSSKFDTFNLLIKLNMKYISYYFGDELSDYSCYLIMVDDFFSIDQEKLKNLF